MRPPGPPPPPPFPVPEAPVPSRELDGPVFATISGPSRRFFRYYVSFTGGMFRIEPSRFALTRAGAERKARRGVAAIIRDKNTPKWTVRA